MKKITIFLSLVGATLVAFGQVAQAQQLKGSPELTIMNQRDLDIRHVIASASSVQFNEIATFQRGIGNSQAVNPQRGENSIQLIQDGNFNAIGAQLMGENSRVQLIQQGNRNILDVQNVQTTNNTLQVVQRGDGNQLVDHGTGFLNRSIRIEQSGGMKLIVQ